MYTNVSKTESRVSSISDFDVARQRTFFQLSLGQAAKTEETDVSFHLYNNRVQRQNPYQFHQIQDKFKKLGRALFCTGTVFCSCISMSSTSSNGILGEDSKHQRLHGYHFFEDSQMQSIGQCMLALWNFNIIYPDPERKLFFLPTVSAGFQAGELGEIHFGLGRTPVKWCENGRKMRDQT